MAMIYITLKLLGPFRSLADGAGIDGVQQLVFAPGARLGEALRSASLPDGVPRVVLLNVVQYDDDPPLGDGDSITIFPPIAGGCPESACRS
jgi:molybdopterin converting factor small subunit